jgi:outer membrane murein-binding lipoprotein Lpp
MTQTNSEPTLTDVVQGLNGLSAELKRLSSDVERLSTDVERLSTDVEKSNDKFEIYRQANQSLVNLAFSLIASATVGLVVSLIFKRS